SARSRCPTKKSESAAPRARWPASPGSPKASPRHEFSLLFENGAPERIRTSDPQIRSLVLYPAELRARLAAGPRRAGHLAASGRGCKSAFLYGRQTFLALRTAAEIL